MYICGITQPKEYLLYVYIHPHEYFFFLSSSSSALDETINDTQ